MDKRMGLYAIEGFTTEHCLGPGHYGISIVIDGDVVKSMLGRKRNQSAPLINEIDDRLKNSVHAADSSIARVEFYEDTWMLTGIYVGGNCACFSIDGGTRSAMQVGDYHHIKYGSHNIDSPSQAGIIISTWLLWFNTLLDYELFEQPHAF